MIQKAFFFLSMQPYLWLGRNKTIGKGEGASGLRFDAAFPKKLG